MISSGSLPRARLAVGIQSMRGSGSAMGEGLSWSVAEERLPHSGTLVDDSLRPRAGVGGGGSDLKCAGIHCAQYQSGLHAPNLTLLKAGIWVPFDDQLSLTGPETSSGSESSKDARGHGVTRGAKQMT